jgi:hypothetical protein
MYVQSEGNCASYIGTIAAFKEYAAAATVAHSHLLFEIIATFPYSLTPVLKKLIKVLKEEKYQKSRQYVVE